MLPQTEAARFNAKYCILQVFKKQTDVDLANAKEGDKKKKVFVSPLSTD
jgi:hypothetical protein